MTMIRFFTATTLVTLSALTVPALAEEAPVGLMEVKTATSGKEDVATQGFVAPAAKPDPASKDATELKISAGGLLSGGNSESMVATATGKLRTRREVNQLEAAVAANYGRSTPAGKEDMETTVENFQGKTRYDRFLSTHVALFLSLSALRDRFQGLNARINLDPGVAYYFVDETSQRLWLELGYDYQLELRRSEFVAAAAALGTPVETSEDQHAARAFAGYENNINEAVRLDTGLEYLQPFSETSGWRMNWNVGLTSSIAGNFSVSATFNLRYDHEPLPGVKKTDHTTALNLVYTLL